MSFQFPESLFPRSSFSRSPWILATQWDNESLEYVLARRTGSRGNLTVVDARSLEHTGEKEFIAELLTAELNKHGARKPEVLVALIRSQVDVFPLELPPATDEELASLVPLQAMQHLGDGTDVSQLDFLPVGENAPPTESPAQSRHVLAIYPQPDVIASIRDVLASCHLAHLTRIGFRPLAALTLAQSMITRPTAGQSTSEPAGSRTLFVTLRNQQADLLLLEGQQLLLNRSIRLPRRNDPVFVENLVSEIRRTEMVAPQGALSDGIEVDQVNNSSISQILASGGFDEEAVWRLVESSVEIPVQLVSPLEYLPQVKKIVVRESGRFAPLVGMLLEHTTGQSTINFLKPRRPSAPASLLRRFGIYAAAAIVVLAVGGYLAYEQRVAANLELSTLRNQVSQAEEVANKLAQRQRIAMAVQQWQADDVNWLDELRDLSLRFPSQQDAFIQRLNAAPAAGGAKAVTLQVRVRDQSLVQAMESNLRDAHHRIVSKRVSEMSANDDFGWQFDATVLITPRNADEYRTAWNNEMNNASNESRPHSPSAE